MIRSDRVEVMAILSLLSDAREAHEGAIEIGKEVFPIGSVVEVGGIQGIVHGAVQLDGTIPVLFSNGNVWDKDIRGIRPNIPEDKRGSEIRAILKKHESTEKAG